MIYDGFISNDIYNKPNITKCIGNYFDESSKSLIFYLFLFIRAKTSLKYFIITNIYFTEKYYKSLKKYKI